MTNTNSHNVAHTSVLGIHFGPLKDLNDRLGGRGGRCRGLSAREICLRRRGVGHNLYWDQIFLLFFDGYQEQICLCLLLLQNDE